MHFITATTGEEFLSPELQLPGEEELLQAEHDEVSDDEHQSCEWGCQDVCDHLMQGEQQ
ncbi:hypothetical protein ACU5P1_02275 [Pseudomonas plecoglossicida]|uniref:hypothetical protein n=1 Tax=Pseudomonas plecoglossicida TaxID=70775 RepID=UPI0012DD5747|nr:hypothetical protein [Pseudomonas plecoglossicida]QLB53726.1 hypothetical protein HAV28_02265 [Pseudomonas plecoglossicida]GLR36277.1 hypothetical protein GCM10011247_16740 [Pseudomonas plecoglossicida]